MTKEIIVIVLLLIVLYLYYQQQGIQTIRTFLKEQLNSDDLEELKTKLGEKSLDKLIEENEDYETEVDTLTRTKNSLEQDLTAQAEAFQARQREKDRELKKLKEDLTSEKKRLQNSQQSLTSEKQQHKGSLERIKLLTEQISKLEKEKQKLEEQVKKIPGEFPDETSSITSEELTDQSKLEEFIE